MTIGEPRVAVVAISARITGILMGFSILHLKSLILRSEVVPKLAQNHLCQLLERILQVAKAIEHPQIYLWVIITDLWT